MDAVKENLNSDAAGGLAAYSDDDIRTAMELLFFAYRDFTAEPDNILKDYNYGRTHHRVIHFVGRYPGITVSELLSILRITKQSLSRVLGQLIREGFVAQEAGAADRRQRLLRLTGKGHDLELRVSQDQRGRIQRAFAAAGPVGVDGFCRVLKAMIIDQDDVPEPGGES